MRSFYCVSGFAQRWILGSLKIYLWMNESCPIFFVFWQPSLTCTTLAWKNWCFGLLLKIWHSKPSLVPTYLPTTKRNPCIHYLCWLYPHNYQQRKPRLTKGPSMTAQKGLWHLATFFRVPSTYIMWICKYWACPSLGLLDLACTLGVLMAIIYFSGAWLERSISQTELQRFREASV